MSKKSFLKFLLAGVLALGFAVLPTRAQVVASGMTGTVVDSSGKPVSGATVIAVHTPTNTTFTGTTSGSGRFEFGGMPVGGPYTVSATASGVTIQPLEGKSLVPILAGKQRAGYQSLFWEHEGNRALRQGKWKLVARSNRE